MKNITQLKLLFVILSSLISIESSATLEDRLSNRMLLNKLDVVSFNSFKDFLIPNEHNPYLIKAHLDLIKKEGLLVSTGTERSFTAFSLCEKCSGLVGVDINPRIKAYNDFNVLLLKLSENREDYLKLRAVEPILSSYKEIGKASDKFENDVTKRDEANLKINDTLNQEIKDSIIEITIRLLKNQDLKSQIKDFYLSNIDNYSRIFFDTQKEGEFLPLLVQYPENLKEYPFFPIDAFKNANYFYDDALFGRLQKAAKDGSLVFVVGDINELDFLNQEIIAAIDTSNIYDYVPLRHESNPKIVNDQARIIWVLGQYMNSKYYSFIPTLKDTKLVNELETIKTALKSKGFTDNRIMPDFFNKDIFDQAPENSSAYHRHRLLMRLQHLIN